MKIVKTDDSTIIILEGKTEPEILALGLTLALKTNKIGSHFATIWLSVLKKKVSANKN